MGKHKYNYRWTLGDAVFTRDKGKVFSCFACGGGSTMGYKLAGFDVIGCNEIDHRMMYTYCQNHDPKYPFLEPIQEFKKREDLPDELYNLDILDGSPPCSTFSMAGSREESWGKMKHFREGQEEQVLDTLFFDFIELAKRGDKILDTHLGSGAICLAADSMGFEMTGIELDPEYYNAAKQRILYQQAQPRLFDAEEELSNMSINEQLLFDL